MEMYEMLQASSGALFSDDKKYRWVLWRAWDFKKPKIMFIGLNPSTANEKKSDPTITRVINFAKSWGYGGVYMLNLFPYVTSKPELLEECSIEKIKHNDMVIKEYAAKSEKIIFAWGGFQVMGRDAQLWKMFPKAECLLMNDDGTPMHPLYVPGKTKPIPYEPIK